MGPDRLLLGQRPSTHSRMHHFGSCPASVSRPLRQQASPFGSSSQAGCTRLRRQPGRPSAATLDAPDTEAEVEQEQHTTLGDVSSISGNGSVSNGSGLSMEHPDKRALYERFFQLLQTDLSPRYEVGDRVTGLVLSVDNTGAYVELGQKAPAYCQASDMTRCKGVKATAVLRPNTQREFVISSKFPDGAMFLSLREIEAAMEWRRLRQCVDNGVRLPAVVESTNQNGLVVKLMGVDGFIPMRYIDKTVELEDYIGQTVNVRLLEMTEETGRLVLAQRITSRTNATKDIQVGKVLDGTVTHLKPFGAFVDVGLVEDGLVHVSQISADRVTKIEDIMKTGDKIKVMVLTYDQATERVNLSTKRLERQPGDMTRNPAAVYAQAEETAKSFRKKVEEAQATSGSQDDD